MKKNANQVWLVGVMSLAVMMVAVLGITGCQSEVESPSKVQPKNKTTGVKSDGSQKPISSLTEASIDQTVSVQGEIIQQCPAIGCWLRLKDETGELFVDLKPGNLGLSEKRVGQQARITGRMVKQGGQLKLEAEKMEFLSKDSHTNDTEK